VSWHTPGPWKTGNGLPPFYAWGGQVIGKHDDGSDFVLASCNQNYPEQAIANAHLIAAAPELLGLVKDLAYMFQDHPHLNNKRIAEIIAKAEGTSRPDATEVHHG
jgi:hypothetical protein